MQTEDRIVVRETQPNPRPRNMSVHGVLGMAGIDLLNRALDPQIPAGRRLPPEWRFR